MCLIGEKSAVLTRRKSMIPQPSTDVVASLGQFVRSDKAKRLVMNSIAFSLTPKQIAEMIDDFNAIDVDQNGVITMDELKNAITGVNAQNSGRLLTNTLPTLESLGISPTVEINYSEFIAAAMCK